MAKAMEQSANANHASSSLKNALMILERMAKTFVKAFEGFKTPIKRLDHEHLGCL